MEQGIDSIQLTIYPIKTCVSVNSAEMKKNALSYYPKTGNTNSPDLLR